MEQKLEALKKKIPSFASNLIILPRFITLLLALFRDARVPRWLKIMSGAMVTYVALPFDFLPDFVPLVGKGDDIIVILLVLIYFMKFAPPEVLREHWFNTMGDDFELEETLAKAMEEIEPVVGARYDYFKSNLEQLLQRIPKRVPADAQEGAPEEA